MEIRVLGPGDDDVLARVAFDVFDHEPIPALTTEFLEDARHHLVVAIDDGLVVGFASGVHYVHPDKPPELWINEVGVAPSHQRLGLGHRILRAMLRVGAEVGCQEAWVLTNRSNLPAMRLYTAAGGTEAAEETVMFTFDVDRPESS
jgi:ribosomal protein S18 acetylase RimI-like enzyme